MKRISLILGIGLLLNSCLHVEIEQESVNDQEICITAFLSDIETKTERQENTDVYWCPGDAVSLFFNQGEQGGYRFCCKRLSH